MAINITAPKFQELKKLLSYIKDHVGLEDNDLSAQVKNIEKIFYLELNGLAVLDTWDIYDIQTRWDETASDTDKLKLLRLRNVKTIQAAIDEELEIDNRIRLTDAEATEILRNISIDANVGINWDVVDSNIDEYLEK
jgi:hypothetical protein